MCISYDGKMIGIVATVWYPFSAILKTKLKEPIIKSVKNIDRRPDGN
jgi:hypothetical protein